MLQANKNTIFLLLLSLLIDLISCFHFPYPTRSSSSGIITIRKYYHPIRMSPRPIKRSFLTASSDKDTVVLEPTMVLTPAGAQCGMTAALAKAAQEGWEVTICICDAGGVPLHVQRTARAFPASYDVACGKAKSAALFRKPTGALEDSVNGGRSALLSAPSFVLMRGGLPIQQSTGSQGHICGAVGVSGVQADQDEEVARAAVEAICSAVSRVPSISSSTEMRSRL